jgi:hypothetical protein
MSNIIPIRSKKSAKKEYVISIKIIEIDKYKALEELERVVKHVRHDVQTYGESDMSEHNDTYLPYYFWACFERDHIPG